jgi:hypothetical protein
MALIFMGRFARRSWKSNLGESPTFPKSSPRAAAIVTAQHNDYTGPARPSKANESPIESRKAVPAYLERFDHAVQYGFF